MSSVSIGYKAEDAAAEFLLSQNLKILHKNFRCKFGEIDLILRDQNHLVFAEVRYRKHNTFGGALESITSAKQRKIVLAAQFFLNTRDWTHQVKCRFDVIAMSQTIESPQIEWIKDAFDGDI